MAALSLSLSLTLLVAAGCGPVAERCRASTLAVAVTLVGAAANADELDVAIALDNGKPVTTTLTHHAGVAGGNVVVEFPEGYPRGKVAGVTVTARAAGVVVGMGSASATLTGACQAVDLTVAGIALADGNATPHDLASDASIGDGASDLSSPASPADLTTAPADLTPGPPDLTPPPPDLYCPGGGVEDCFNGLDDDCDGHIDCDDSDCAPVAVCVPPVTAPFAYGTQEPSAGTCPTHTSGGPIYVKDPNGGGCTSTCSCGSSGCSTTFGLTLGCGGGFNGTPFTLSSTCEAVDEGSSYSWGAIAGTLACAQSGTAAPVKPPTLTSAVSCALTGAPGGGCDNGQVCVARGTKQCVATGTAGATCPAGYPTGATWYSGFVDGRNCGCTCTAAAAGCNDSSVGVDFYDSKGCIDTARPETSPYCSDAYQAVKIAGGCSLTVNQTGAISFNGASTVCCQ
ncbi:MAG TPA: hypothetical protein VIA18_02770 [Polyangia bacterium]|nr:hypothetical protein [Polyangia bacterium]